MKRFCSLLLLLAVALTLFCGLTAVAADESEQVQYQVTAPLDVYVESGDDYAKVFSVPVSYYVFKSGEAVGDYTPIVYGNLTDAPQFFVKTSELRANAKIDDWDLSADAKRGAYLLDQVSVAATGTLTVATPAGTTSNLNADDVTITQFYGIRTEDNSAGVLPGTYLFVRIDYSILGKTVTSDVLIPAGSTSVPAISLTSVPLHHEEKPDITPDDPVIDTPDGDAAEPGQGNVVRGIMIALICVLCVVVIFLIFKPTRNRKDRYDL
ncbi:MAG TPA: hypothetical protein IAB15_05560 [Candidatus Ornithoclostridium faecigallinarum]|nr:hypothetical protein [Candidatus Ornithoclostridium faecigallinarum]